MILPNKKQILIQWMTTKTTIEKKNHLMTGKSWFFLHHQKFQIIFLHSNWRKLTLCFRPISIWTTSFYLKRSGLETAGHAAAELEGVLFGRKCDWFFNDRETDDRFFDAPVTTTSSRPIASDTWNRCYKQISVLRCNFVQNLSNLNGYGKGRKLWLAEMRVNFHFLAWVSRVSKVSVHNRILVSSSPLKSFL